jgi:hypothetical protein
MIPVVFPGQDSGAAYLIFKNNRYTFAGDSKVVKPPHAKVTFDSTKRTDPTREKPFTTLSGEDGTSSLSFGLGPIHGPEVQGYLTTGGTTNETYYLLTYDSQMEDRLKTAAPPSWSDIVKKEWNAYILKPQFTAFVSAKPAPLSFDRDTLQMRRPNKKPWLDNVALADDRIQPLEAKSKGRTIKIYRVAEGNTPLLIGMISASKENEVWFFAVAVSSSPTDEK